MNENQKSKIIEALNPPLQEMYRKAYMLKNYDRPESIRILNEVVLCRIEFLPAWQKARKLLDSGIIRK